MLALVAPLITHPTSRKNIVLPIPILSSKKHFSSALKLSGLAKCDAIQANKLLDGASPHRKVTVITAATWRSKAVERDFMRNFD